MDLSNQDLAITADLWMLKNTFLRHEKLLSPFPVSVGVSPDDVEDIRLVALSNSILLSGLSEHAH